MPRKSRHPTTIFVSSGLVITLALLPLYLGQLERFRPFIGDRVRLVGLAVATLAFLVGAWSVLNHSGRPKDVGDADEPTATETWLKAVDLVWKFAAAIAIIVTTNWFAVVLKEEQDQRKSAEEIASRNKQKEEQAANENKQKEERAASERKQYEAEKNAQAEASAVQLRQSVFELLTNQDPYLRLIAVANLADLVSSDRASGLSAAETLFVVALRDPHEVVKAAATKCLPSGVLGVDEKSSYVAAIFQLAQKQVSQPSSASGQGNVQDRRLLEALNIISQFAANAADKSLATDLAVKLSQSEIAAAKQASDTYASQKTTVPSELEQNKIDTFAPAVVLAAANSGDEKKVAQASAILQNTSAEAVRATIQQLPAAIVKKLSPRVYLHIASESQRGTARTLQGALIAKDYIVPGIQNVAGKGYVPDTLEVRYFDPASKAKAEAILKVFTTNGAKDGRVSYVIPTANDLRISPDIKSHFEVWAGRNSF